MKTMDNLRKDESFVTQARVHWACLLPHIILIVFGIGLFTIWASLIRMFTTDFVLTNRRLYGKVGWIKTTTMDTPLDKLNSISVDRGLMGRILGYGTVQVTSPAGTYEFKGIKAPEAFRDAVIQEIEKFEEYRIKKQATEMAAAMKN